MHRIGELFSGNDILQKIHSPLMTGSCILCVYWPVSVRTCMCVFVYKYDMIIRHFSFSSVLSNI